METATQSQPQEIKHSYIDVAGDVLGKPNALCDLIEAEGSPSTIVFCNMPSDTDLVQAVLRKRGIKCAKLIGHITDSLSGKIIRDAQAGLTPVIIATDIGARNVDPQDVALVVNYSIPTDPEVYVHRTSGRSTGNLRKAVSLVSPLDLANFHYIKKVTCLDMQPEQLPAPEVLLVKKLDVWAEQGGAMNLTADARFRALSEKLDGHPKAKEIIAYLFHTVVDIVPSLQSNVREGGERRDDGGYEGRGGRQERNDRNDRGDGRGDRGGDRYDRRGGRDGRRGRGRDTRYGDQGDQGGNEVNGNRSEDESFGNRDESFGNRDEGFTRRGSDYGDDDRGYRGGRDRGPRGDRNDRGDRGDRNDRYDEGGYRSRDNREPMEPPVRDSRLYLGHGRKGGFNREKLQQILEGQCGYTADTVKRFLLRENYSYVDVPEEKSEEILGKLRDIDMDGGKVFVRKATVISAPRENRAPQNEMPMDEGGDNQAQVPSSSADETEPVM